jgi:hypothetical protein
MRVTPRGMGRSVDRGVGGPGIEPRNENSPGCRRFLCSGRQHGGVRHRECPAGPAWSEALARRRNLLSGNREISWLAVWERTVHVGKAGRPKPMMHGDEKSDPAIVAIRTNADGIHREKPANEGGQPPEELVEPRGGGQGERDRARHAPDTGPGKHVPRAGSRTASSEAEG